MILSSFACLIMIRIGFLLNMQIFDPRPCILGRNLLMVESKNLPCFSECVSGAVKWAVSGFFHISALVTPKFFLLSKNSLNLSWPTCLCPFHSHSVVSGFYLSLDGSQNFKFPLNLVFTLPFPL